MVLRFLTVLTIITVLVGPDAGLLHAQTVPATPKPTVQELVHRGDVVAQVMEMRVLPTSTEFDISLFSVPSGKRMLGYAPPYVSKTIDYKELWRAYLTNDLKLPINVDDLSITESNDTTIESYAIALTLDNSPSMTRPRAVRMQRAVQHLLSSLDTNDLVSVVNFTGRTETQIALTNDHYKALATYAAVEGIDQRAGGTAVYDGIMASLEELAKTPASTDRALIVFTDGEDNTSAYRMEEVIARAKTLNVKIYAIVYGMTDRRPLDQLTRETGGKIRELTDADSFDKVFLGLYNSLRHTYTVTIKTQAPEEIESVLSAVTTVRTDQKETDIHTSGIVQMLPKQDVSIPSDVQTASALVVKMNVNFDDRAMISPRDVSALDSIATVLIQRADIDVEISNDLHGSSTNSDSAEMALLRTDAIREFLIKRGVAPSRVRSLGDSRLTPPLPDRNLALVFSKR